MIFKKELPGKNLVNADKILFFFFLIYTGVFLAAEPVLLLDSKQEGTSWQAQGETDVNLTQDSDRLRKISFKKPYQPVWNSHLAETDLSNYGSLVLIFASGEESRVVVALKDIYGVTGVTVIKIPASGGEIKIPLSVYYLQGLMLQYIKSLAFWSPDESPSVFSLSSITLSQDGAKTVRPRGTLLLLDAEEPYAAVYKFNYSRKWVTVSTGHAARGSKSYFCKFPGKEALSIYGVLQHDWRDFKNIAFDLWLPGEKEMTLRFKITDSWVKGCGSSATLQRELKLKPGANQVIIGLDTLEKIGNLPGAFNLQFVQKVSWDLPEIMKGEKIFYLDNVRLEGEGKLSQELIEARKNIPVWGYDKIAELKLPGDYKLPVLPESWKTTLSAGAAKVKVTPPAGTPLSEEPKSEGILDDLYIRALVMKSGEREIALLVLDTLYFPKMPEIARACSASSGIKESNFYFSATHNHNAGAPYASKVFTQLIIDGAVQAVKEAKGKLQSVYARVAETTLDINYNRDQKGSDGRYYTILDHRYLNKTMDSLPASKVLYALALNSDDGKPVGVLVNYSAHANSLCRVCGLISADWPGSAARLLEEKTGAVSFVINGAFGNTNARDFNIDYDSTLKIGADVAVAALGSLAKVTKKIELDNIGIYKVMNEGPAVDEKKGKPQPLPVTALRLGPVVFIDPGGELFTEFTPEIRKEAALPYVFFSFSAGYYFPTHESFAVNGYGTKNRKEEWSSIVVNSIKKLIKDIAAGKAKAVDE